MDFNNGGKKAIERLVEAYGFTTRQALCDHLGVSKSTMATRYMRDIFPADWVLQCAMETGLSIQWLSFGVGPKEDANKIDTVSIPKKKLVGGKLVDDGFYFFDKQIIPKTSSNLIAIADGNASYIAEQSFAEVTDGKWLVEIEGAKFIRDIVRIPVRKVKVIGGEIAFDCELDDINIIYKIVVKIITL